jgi:hypothetical protein
MRTMLALAAVAMLAASPVVAADMAKPAPAKAAAAKPAKAKPQPKQDAGTTACPGVPADSQAAADCLMQQELSRLATK